MPCSFAGKKLRLFLMNRCGAQVIVRPATVFGPEDRFLTWVAEASERLPFVPLLNGGSALVQPVYSVDVGRALLAVVYVSTLLYRCE